jgi:hypothetical protein
VNERFRQLLVHLDVHDDDYLDYHVDDDADYHVDVGAQRYG